MSLAWRSSDARVRVPALQVKLELDLVFGDRIRQRDPVGLGIGVQGASNDRRGVARGELQIALRFHVSTE